MMKSKIGPVTAYADAVQAGYTGTREEFGRQQADFAKNAASVEQAKTEVNQAIESFGQTANVAKQDVIAEGDRQVQRIEDIAPDLSLDREQITSNTVGVREAKATAEEAKAIAKGRATGYVFDTVSDMETWLASEENIKNLVLGDNLYIRATDVPDYWWDGEQAQPLETQKVDMEEYVKFTDYGKYDTPNLVIIQSNRSLARGVTLNSGYLELSRLYESEIKGKSSVSKCALMTSNIDMISAQSAHQEMSNDYNPSTAVTPDGNVPYAYGDRQPVSYAAVKKYIDDTYGETWKDAPVMEFTLEEEVTSIYVEQINGESFEFEKLLIEEFSNAATKSDTEMRICVAPCKINSPAKGICCTSDSTAGTKSYSKVEIENKTGIWIATGYTSPLVNWTTGATGIREHRCNTNALDNINIITSFTIMAYTGTLSPGVSFKIYGKPARKGVTT